MSWERVFTFYWHALAAAPDNVILDTNTNHAYKSPTQLYFIPWRGCKKEKYLLNEITISMEDSILISQVPELVVVYNLIITC